MENYLVIHGHFYQPPREDPWSGVIQRQTSASPYHDWNQRITKECYAANSASRVLNGQGKITDIVNNYQYISFNFGPTLFRWLKVNAPNVYSRIIEADEISRGRNNGHGNAIAQAFNHTILPLDNLEDIITQIKWAMEDFRSHFNRQTEGIWLPETAVNDQVIDVLIDEGITFIILSPWQAEARCRIGTKTWEPLHDQPINSEKAYRINRSRGSIAVFFYNNILAQGISFEHYLTNADNLYQKLLHFHNPKKVDTLISVATDGEVYGHHEPFGDMCLAALSKMVNTRSDFQFTNFGNYLELHPPQELVRLKEGEGGHGTSWSCSHGVSRWFKDCGCSTGGDSGWNQKWRTPLRKGLVQLRNTLEEHYHCELKKITSIEPSIVRNRYIEVISDTVSRDDFAASVLLSSENFAESKRTLFRLLEGQKYSLFMFTSCGWFFSDISGIETLQNLRYAVKAAELHDASTDRRLWRTFITPLKTHLEKAVSNIEKKGTGKEILESILDNDPKDLDYFASLFALVHSLCAEPLSHYGFFQLVDSHDEKGKKEADTVEYAGTVTIENVPLTLSSIFDYRLIDDDETGLHLSIKDSRENDFRETEIQKLPSDFLDKCTCKLSHSIHKQVIRFSSRLFGDMKKILQTAKNAGFQPSPLLKKAAELVISGILINLFAKHDTPADNDHIQELEEILILAKERNIEYNHELVEKQIGHSLTKRVNMLTHSLDNDSVDYIYRILKALRRGGIEPNVTIPQNIVFSIIQEKAPLFEQSMEEGEITGLRKMRKLIKLGSILNIEVENLKKRILKIEE